MAVTLSNIETKVRYLIGDNTTSMVPGAIFTYTSSAVFTIPDSNVISVSAVLVNDSEIGASEYSHDTSTNQVTVTASLTSGDTIEIQYTYYPNYSSTEIQNYIRASLVHISANNFKDWIRVDYDVEVFDPLSNIEEKFINELINNNNIGKFSDRYSRKNHEQFGYEDKNGYFNRIFSGELSCMELNIPLNINKCSNKNFNC